MKLYAVVHAVTWDQVMRNVAIARSGGADGIFLISHGVMDSFGLTRVYYDVREEHPDWFIGMNYLDLSNTQSISSVPASASALWCDDVQIDTDEENPTVFANIIREQRRRREDWKGLYFGGVAFKYQKQPRDEKDLTLVTRLAVPFVDVITTSGDETGKPPTLEKILAMRTAAGKHPIAVASGMNAKNIRQFIGPVDYALVSTGISSSHEKLHPRLVRELAAIIHGESPKKT